eukprot:CAMPEP_0118924910 /NCGR_PEP_ID=MMETSP1169-20130426/2840_1 /TAXON_ID=36882 /ORGANISM="Pyramimonas obovata, Strain CCMP722" /LENGTH=1153 /DNA_ID=CAMNT_0006866059 /DNA_START=133 /DNA_END=3590 /DNA_ORIENTATION=-
MDFTSVAALVCLALLAVPAAHGYSDDINPKTGRPYNHIMVGGLGIRGEEDLYNRWNATFTEYLTANVDRELNLTFELVYLNFDTTYEMVENKQIDMVYTNPSVYACLEREYGAAPVASLLNRRKVGDRVYQLSKFFGTFIVRNDSTITKIAEIEDKTVEAVSLVGLGAAQLQWDELTRRGLQFLSMPKQIRFAFSQKNIIKDVLAGTVDIGMIRTDLYEGFVAKGEFPEGGVKVLEDLRDPDDPDAFPFPYSTTLAAPEWSLGALPWLDWEISRAVSETLYSITSDTPAALAGQYETWVAPLSYLGIHEMQQSLGWIDKNNQCIRNGDTCEMVVCPAGSVKKSCDKIENGCADAGLECPDSYVCLCKPCEEVPTVEYVVRVMGRKSDQVDSPTSLNHTEPCTKMAACAEGLQQTDLVTVRVTDNWADVRQALGAVAPDHVEYQWGDLSTWQRQSAAGNLSGMFEFVLPANDIGSQLLRIRTCAAGQANCTEVVESPFLLEVNEKVCLDDKEEPNAAGICECVDCGDSNTTVIIAVVAVVGVVVAAAVAVVLLRKKKEDTSWQILLEEIDFGSPPVVLGRGTFGQVLRAEFRGTDVAVKRVLPKFATMEDKLAELFKKQESVTLNGPGIVLTTQDSFDKANITDSAGSDLETGERRRSRGSRGASMMAIQKTQKASDAVLVAGARIDPMVSGTSSVDALSSKSDSAYESQDPDAFRRGSFRQSVRRSFKRASFKLTGVRPSGTDELTMEKYLKLQNDFMKEMQVMVYLRHPNIVTVMGAVAGNSTQEPLMVMENMQHGSLYDLVNNSTMQFEGDIVMDILNGLISGMIYLHSTNPPVLHNDLKTANVLVSANFQAKLTDFGLSMKKKSSGFLGTPFWMAPELFAQDSKPTTATDVYSFAITLFEIFTRTEPYREHGDPSYVLKRLSTPDLDPEDVMRPKLPMGLPEFVESLMRKCWNQNAADRPTFAEVKEEVATWDKAKINQWFESFDEEGNSSVLIGGAQKRDVKEKRLLHDVFPKHIADQLKEGKKVEPQQHSAVTIFFSDIVGFTDISKQLEPIQVMKMLDRLYNKFDTVARKHGVFKVETIGDAYMAVANLVVEQPNHTELIANFSIEAILAAQETIISEEHPDMGCVNIRVGFHSGPVVSSVVGTMNP